jgi:hypothetical protein
MSDSGPIDARRAARAVDYSRSVDDDIPGGTSDDRAEQRAARHREERRAVEEAGGGQSEGFELAEQELIEHASHGDEHTPDRVMQDAVGPDEEDDGAVYGEADSEHHDD